MAQVIVEDREIIAVTLQSWLRVIGLGAVVGLAIWVLSALLGRYAFEPLLGETTNGFIVAGKVATVLVATGAVLGMVRLGVARPIVIAVASAALLWDLSVWSQGMFWLEAVAWSVLLYVASYALFGWIARHGSALVAMIVTIIIVVVIRLALAA